MLFAGVAVGYAVQRRVDDKPIILPWRASDRKIPGLTFEDEGIWQGPYFFVLGADTQLGLIDSFNNVTVNPSWNEELRRLDLIISRLNAMNLGQKLCPKDGINKAEI